jgi:hypothetical protein
MNEVHGRLGGTGNGTAASWKDDPARRSIELHPGWVGISSAVANSVVWGFPENTIFHKEMPAETLTYLQVWGNAYANAAPNYAEAVAIQ